MKIKTIGGINVSEVIANYLIAALWVTNDESDERGGEPLDKNYGIDDCSDDMLKQTYNDVVAFLQENHQDCSTWNGETTIEEQTGHDLFLTRNGHGCGFWEPEWNEPGERLDQAAKKLGEVYPYVGDNGKIYL